MNEISKASKQVEEIRNQNERAQQDMNKLLEKSSQVRQSRNDFMAGIAKKRLEAEQAVDANLKNLGFSPVGAGSERPPQPREFEDPALRLQKARQAEKSA